MNTNKLIPIIAMFLVMVGIVYGAATCATSCISPRIASKGQSLICNATITGNTGATWYNATNASMWIKSNAQTPNSTYLHVVKGSWLAGTTEWVKNSSAKGSGATLNQTLPLSVARGLVDGTDYKVIIMIGNYSALADARNYINCTATTTTQRIDTSKPSCALSGITANSIYELENTNTITLSADNGTSLARLYVGSTSEYVNMTRGSWSGITIPYTYDLSNFVDGIYDIYGVVSDDTNETTCATLSGVTLKYRRGNTAGDIARTQQLAAQQKAQQAAQAVSGEGLKGTLSKITPIGWIVILVGLYFIGKKKKWF